MMPDYGDPARFPQVAAIDMAPAFCFPARAVANAS